jgi:hypothetical protein
MFLVGIEIIICQDDRHLGYRTMFHNILNSSCALLRIRDSELGEQHFLSIVPKKGKLIA